MGHLTLRHDSLYVVRITGWGPCSRVMDITNEIEGEMYTYMPKFCKLFGISLVFYTEFAKLLAFHLFYWLNSAQMRRDPYGAGRGW